MTEITGDLFAPRRPERHYGRDAWAGFLARMVDVQIVVLPTFLVIAFGVGVVHGIHPIPAVAAYLSVEGLPRFLMDTGLM
jgi:hypothetical protein